MKARSERLSGQDGCAVTRCACGELRLTFGPLDLRLSEEALHGLAAVLADASARVVDEKIGTSTH